MLNSAKAIFAKYILHVYEFGMTGIRHAMITHEHDVNDVIEGACGKGDVQVTCEGVDL